MPLVNEVVIGLKDKDKFNASRPKDDAANFADYVTHPTLPALIQVLFGAQAPTNFPRTDLMTAFLTGLPTVNRPGNITALGTGGPLAEMLRLNTGIAATPACLQTACLRWSRAWAARSAGATSLATTWPSPRRCGNSSPLCTRGHDNQAGGDTEHQGAHRKRGLVAA